MGTGGAAVDNGDVIGCPEPPVIAPEVEVTIKGFSVRLLTRDSTGTDADGAVTGTGPVTFWPGVAISFPVFGGKKGTGNFGPAIV